MKISVKSNEYNFNNLTINKNFFDFYSVGFERAWNCNNVPFGWLFLHGQLLLRSEYPRLFAWAKTNNLIIDDNDWLVKKKYGYFSYGDGVSNFRLMDKRGLYDVGYEQGYHSGLGEYQQDQFQGHQHRFSMAYNPLAYIGGEGNGGGFCRPTMGSTNNSTNDCINSGTNGIPRTGMRTQPRSLPRNYIIKY